MIVQNWLHISISFLSSKKLNKLREVLPKKYEQSLRGLLGAGATQHVHFCLKALPYEIDSMLPGSYMYYQPIFGSFGPFERIEPGVFGDEEYLGPR